MKKIILFLVFIISFPLIKSTQEYTYKKRYFDVTKEEEYFVKVKVVPSFERVVRPSEIEEKEVIEEKDKGIDIAEEVRDEIMSTEEKAIENINSTEAEAIEEIKSFGIKSIEEKFIEQIKTLKEKKVSEIKAIGKELIEKIESTEEKKAIEIREVEKRKTIEEEKSIKEIISGEIFKDKKDIEKEDNKGKENLVEKIFEEKQNIEKRAEEEIKSIEEKAKTAIENVKIYRIPDIKYVEAWTIKEINAIKEKTVEEKKTIEKKVLEELKDLERMAKELNLAGFQIEEKMPIFRISQNGKIDKKIENLWLISDLEAKEIEEKIDYLKNFELNFLPEKPITFKTFPNFRIDYCIFENKNKQCNLKFHFNIDSDKDGIADILAVTEENDLERNPFLHIQFGKDGFHHPFKIKNKRYLIERELGLKVEDNWYYDFVNASFRYDFQKNKVVINANFEGKDFSDVMLRRRFYKLDLQKYPFLSIDYEVVKGQIPQVHLALRIDTTGNGRPDKTIISPMIRETSGELIFNAYEVAKKNFPGEKVYFLVEATIHVVKKDQIERDSSVIYLKKFSSFNYIAPNFINRHGKKEEKKLVYIYPQKVEIKDKSSNCGSIEINLKSQISQINNKDWDKYDVLSGKIFIKNQEEIKRINNLRLLIKEAYFSPSKELIERLRLLEKRVEEVKQYIPLKKEKIEKDKAIENKDTAVYKETIKKEESTLKKDIAKEKESIEDKDIPNFLSEMTYPTLKYSSVLDVLEERKLFFQEIGYREQFNLSPFKTEKSFNQEDEKSGNNSWKIINQNCDYTAERKNNSVDFKIKFKGRSMENSLLKLKKQISLDLNKFNVLKLDVEDIPLGGEIICKLFIKAEGKKQEISFKLKANKEYDLLKNFPNKKVILSEMILILKPLGEEIFNRELDFKLKDLSFYSYKQGNMLDYLKNTYVNGSQSEYSINIGSNEVESGGVRFFDFYKDKRQNLVFIFNKSETNENKIKHFFDPVFLIKKWKNFEFDYFIDNPKNLEISFQFLIDLFGDGKTDKRVVYRPELISKNIDNTNLVSLDFGIFESINSFLKYYPEARIKGFEIYIIKTKNGDSFLESKEEANLFLLSNLRIDKGEYEDTIYNEMLNLPLVEMDGKGYRLNQAETFNDNLLIQAITESRWFILGRTRLKKGRHELKILKHPWLKAEMVEIAE